MKAHTRTQTHTQSVNRWSSSSEAPSRGPPEDSVMIRKVILERTGSDAACAHNRDQETHNWQ